MHPTFHRIILLILVENCFNISSVLSNIHLFVSDCMDTFAFFNHISNVSSTSQKSDVISQLDP